MRRAICDFVSMHLETTFSYSLKHVVLLIVLLIRLDPLTCSECNDFRMFSTLETDENHYSSPPVLPKPMLYELLTTLPSQEYYDVENTGKYSLIEDHKSIIYHQDSIANKENNFSPDVYTVHDPTVNGESEYFSGFSEPQNPIMSEETKFSAELSTVQNPTLNDGYKSSTEVPAIHNPITNGSNELSSEYSTSSKNLTNEDTEFSSTFSAKRNQVANSGYKTSDFSAVKDHSVNLDSPFPSEFPTMQTLDHTNRSRLSDGVLEANKSQESQLTSHNPLKETHSANGELEYNYLNMTDIIGYLIGYPSNYVSDIITKNLIRVIGNNAYCRHDDLSVSFECLKEKLLQDIKYLMIQKALKFSETVRLIRVPMSETRTLQRGLWCGLWDAIVSFFRTRVLKVTVPEVASGSLPTFVATARVTQGRDNSSRFEVGLELPEDSKDADVEEGRGVKKKKAKKLKKVLLYALMAKVALIAKTVLGGAVILAKKALLVSLMALAMSSVAASKKKSASNAATDDHTYAYRRLGTVNYIDLKPGNPEHGDNYIDPLFHTETWPASHNYYDQSYPNFINNREDLYADENGSYETQSKPYSYSNKYNTYNGKSNWLGVASHGNV